MSKRPAFTLIEMLIVVTIIAVLASLAVSSYGLANQKAKLDVLADTLVSVLKQRQNLVKNGKTTVINGGSWCYGLLFDTTQAGNKAVQVIQAPYVSVSRVDADVCDMTKMEKSDFEQMNNYIISSIKKDDVAFDNLTILFKPPFANTVLLNDTRILPTGSSVIDVTLKSLNQPETRAIRFDTAAALIQRI